MSEETERLLLPLIDAGQAQKEVTHNEALARLDLLVQPGVVAAGVDDPPATPTPGQAWVVGSAPTAAWAGHAGEIAGWTAGGWRFAAPSEGFAAWSSGDAATVRFRAGAWETGQLRGAALVIAGTPVVGAQRPAIADPTGGSGTDTRARSAIGDILAALRAHGLIAS